MFHRIGAAAYKADLSNTWALMERLDHPEKSFRSVHVAGTNGKGSTSHMLAAIFQQCGYKTGLYTSPHLLDFRERIRINGEQISREAVVAFVEEHRSMFEAINPSFFEWTVALAFDHFRKEQVDVAIIETGLGGRLDSTNVIHPELSVITNIGWDHMNLLGDSLEKIAGEKAGIIKPGIPVVIGERSSITDPVFESTASRVSSPIRFASDSIRVSPHTYSSDRQSFRLLDHAERVIELDLPGHYQQKNLATVWASLRILREAGWKLDEKDILTALSKVRQLTGLMGRWQSLSASPRVIADVGHNVDGIREIISQMKTVPHRHLRWVIGMVSDKDVSAVLKLLPVDATYYCCAPDLPRAMPAEQLEQAARTFGLSTRSCSSVAAAVQSAMADAGSEDLVFIGGSTFVVAEALPLFTT